jgi:hypothetical protein
MKEIIDDVEIGILPALLLAIPFSSFGGVISLFVQ